VAERVLAERAVEHIPDEALRHALFAGYADRLARRRPESSDRYLLATGHGASLAREAAADAGEFIVALDVTAAQRDGIGEARIRAASRVEREWITPTSVGVDHRLDAEAGRVRAVRVTRYDAIVLNEAPVAPHPVIRARLFADAWQIPPELERRIRFAGLALDLPAVVAQATALADRLEDVDVVAHLPFETRRTLETLAPETLVVPSGRTMRLQYGDDGSVACSVKLQELFGLAESPTLGPNRVPVTFHLLAPNGRPVQTTRDLRSFWERTYPEVRKELRGRYPKHPWPEDPWNAPPTHKTTRRS
jgi:ATP-dependent helicase HrpB